VNAPTPRKRKPASPQSGRIVKASVSVDVALHARWCAAASLSGIARNAFAVEALKRALEGIVIVDRRKTSDRIKTDDRPDLRTPISNDKAEAAWSSRLLPILPRGPSTGPTDSQRGRDTSVGEGRFAVSAAILT
jgi:hypothetical protein